jgi:hypothetical protein
MPRWLRVIRGMVGNGLTFAAGIGGAAAVIGGLVWLGHGITGRDLMGIVGKFSVASFLLGIAFSSVLAITARGRQFNKLSVRLVSTLGAGAGLLYFGFLSVNGGRNWSPRDAIANFVLLTLMGAGAAAATLLIARRTTSAITASPEVPSLGARTEEIVHAPANRSKVDIPRL